MWATRVHRRLSTMSLRMTCVISFYYGNSHTHCGKSSAPSFRGCEETRRFYTETLLYRDAFTHRRFYTQTHLHAEAFTPRRFSTQKLLHTETGPVKSQFFLSFWRSTSISRERVAMDKVKSQFFLSFWRPTSISCERVARDTSKSHFTSVFDVQRRTKVARD